TSSSPLVFLTLLGSISISFGQSDEKAQLGSLMWAAFQCGTYAGLSGDEKEQARLFEVGLKAGREFLDAINKGQITDEAKRKIVPVAVMQLLRFTGPPLPPLGAKILEPLPKEVEGQSTDFVLGRIFQDATSSAYKITREAQATKVLHGHELIKDQARTKYRTGNCALVKSEALPQQSTPASDAQPSGQPAATAGAPTNPSSAAGERLEFEERWSTAAPAPEQSTAAPAPEQPRGWIAEVKKSRPICASADDYVQIQRTAFNIAKRPSHKAMQKAIEFAERKCPIAKFEPGDHVNVERTETFSIDKTKSITLACVVIKDGPCAWTDASQLVRIPEGAQDKKSTQSHAKSVQDAFEERPEQPQDAAAKAARPRRGKRGNR